MKREIISLENYIKFVDSVYDILNTKNNKPIFVPISLRLKQGELTTLIQHYLKREYYYYWLDFEGRPVNENRLAHTRHIFRKIKEAQQYDKTITYFTNVKREILPNANNPVSEASDVLSSIAGANLIGVNREPRRYFDSDGPPPPPVPPNYKARIFDNETYYYNKTNNPNLFHKYGYTPVNAQMLNFEFKNQTEFFLNNDNIGNLLNKKKMLTDFHSGNLLRELTSKEQTQISIKDFWT